MSLAKFLSFELPMIPFKNIKLPEAMPLILKAIQTVDSGLLRLKLQMKWDPFSKLTYLILFCVWFRFDSLGLFYPVVESPSIGLLKDRAIS